MELNRKRPKDSAGAFVLFDIVYEDGSRSSNRRVDRAIVESFDGAPAVKAAIEQQDRIIADRAQRPQLSIKSIQPSGKVRRA